MTTRLIPLWLALLASSAAAQSKPTQPPAQIRASDANSIGAISSLIRWVSPEMAVPGIEAGKHLVLTLENDGEVSASIGEGEVAFEFDAAPPALMKLFPDQVKFAQRQARALLGMQYASIGIGFNEAAGIVNGAFSLPGQIERLSVRTHPPAEDDAPLRITIDIWPVPDTWLSELITNLQQSERGVFAVPNRGALSGEVCVNATKIQRLIEPVFEPFYSMGVSSREDLERSRKLVREAFLAFDGTASFSSAADGSHMTTVAGLRDPEAYRAMIRKPWYLERSKNLAALGGLADVEFTEAAFECNGVAFDQMRVELHNRPPFGNPLIDDSEGAWTAAWAVAGDQIVSATGKVDAETKPLQQAVDALTSDKAARTKLPPLTFVDIRMKLAKIVSRVAGAIPNSDVAMATMPEDVRLTISKSPQSVLKLQAELK